MLVTNADVTLTDFRLFNASYMSFWDSSLKVNGTSMLTHNTGVLTAINTLVHFDGNTLIAKNFALEYLLQGVIVFQKANVTFSGNTTIYLNYVVTHTCLSAEFGSVLTFRGGNTTIKNNIGQYGGGMALFQGSKIVIKHMAGREPTSLNLIGNIAHIYGGGIYINDDYVVVRESLVYRLVIPCWLTIDSQTAETNFGLNLEKNKAFIAGDELFGGWLNYCQNVGEENTLIGQQITETIHMGNTVLSSKPVRICLCIEQQPNCTVLTKLIRIVPGQSFNMYAVAVGQGYGAVPGIVEIVMSGEIDILEVQKSQLVGNSCTKLTFTAVLTTHPHERTYGIAKMKVDRDPVLQTIIGRYPNQTILEDVLLKLLPLPCFKGYTLNNITGACECSEALTKQGIECQIENGTVKRNKEWISVTLLHTAEPNQRSPGILVHYFCPLDYCKSNLVYLSLDEPDQQCQYSRSGTLCGKCEQNTSAVFGTSKCLQCSNYWVFLIIPLVLLAGVGLVLLLTVLSLTVSIGTINGLIFYANIIRANQSVFFSSETNSFLSWFIAWLNLDLGFEVCFYNDMDTYTKTWLQFVFPLYVWFLVTLMITCSHYSTTASRLTANNAVQVLATLFLLSYTKLLRITIVSLSFTTLQYPDGYTERVWLYDGNIHYMRGRHLVLFVAALAVLVLLSVPYTLLLFSIQWLQRYTHYTALRWGTRFKPIFDAYTGPYKSRHRYWTGLLLLVRVLLFLVFSLNVLGDPTINLLAIVTTILCILTYSAYVGGVYRNGPWIYWRTPSIST